MTAEGFELLSCLCCTKIWQFKFADGAHPGDSLGFNHFSIVITSFCGAGEDAGGKKFITLDFALICIK